MPKSRKMPYQLAAQTEQERAELEAYCQGLSDAELESIVGYDAIGLKLRSMTLEQLEALANPLISGLGQVIG